MLFVNPRALNSARVGYLHEKREWTCRPAARGRYPSALSPGMLATAARAGTLGASRCAHPRRLILVQTRCISAPAGTVVTAFGRSLGNVPGSCALSTPCAQLFPGARIISETQIRSVSEALASTRLSTRADGESPGSPRAPSR